jgi:hypothetical protein
MPPTKVAEGRSNAFAALLARHGLPIHKSNHSPVVDEIGRPDDSGSCSDRPSRSKILSNDLTRLSLMRHSIDRREDSNLKRMLHLQAEEIEVLAEKLRLKDDALEIAKQSLNCATEKTSMRKEGPSEVDDRGSGNSSASTITINQINRKHTLTHCSRRSCS